MRKINQNRMNKTYFFAIYASFIMCYYKKMCHFKDWGELKSYITIIVKNPPLTRHEAKKVLFATV